MEKRVNGNFKNYQKQIIKLLIQSYLYKRVLLQIKACMAHRIAKKQQARHQTESTQPNSQVSHAYNGDQQSNHQTHNKLPRPLLPSADTVITHDKFAYRQGKAPFPSPESLFISNNNYDAGPEFLRPTSALTFGNTRKSSFPLGVWISPFGSDQVHKVHVNSPLRCTRCKAYVNGYFRFDGSKTSATCNICGISFAIDRATVDANNLNSAEIATEGVMDFVVKDKIFMKKRIDIVKILLAIQINNFMIESNAFSTIIQSAKAAIQNSQFGKNARIGVVLFNGEGIIYPKLSKSENWDKKMPQKFNVKYSAPGLCCPLSDKELLFDPDTEKQKLIYLIDCVAKIAEDQHKNSKYITQGANYAVVLKSIMQNFQNQIGRILLFSHTAPRSGPMALRPRNEEDGKVPLKPLSPDYYQLSKQLVKARIGVDMYIIAREVLASQELPTTHFLATHTGGSIHLYSPYIPQNHSENLYYNVYGSLTRKYVYDVNFTARLSNGLNVSSFGIGDGIHETRDISLGMMDSQSSITINYEQEQKIEESSAAFVQFAIMFTTEDGERVIRIINYRFQITNKIQNIHEASDYLAVANVLLRQVTSRMFRGDVIKAREDLILRLSAILSEYVQEGGSKMKASSFMAHPNLAPAFAIIHTFINSKVFLNHLKAPSDYQICEALKVNTSNFFNFSNFLYPKLFSLGTEIYDSTPVPGDLIEGEADTEESVVLPPTLPLTVQFISKQGVYLHWSSDYLLILVQPEAPASLLVQLFGTDRFDQIEGLTCLPEQESAHSIRVNLIIEQIRRRTSKNSIFLPLLVRTPFKKGPFNDLMNMVLKEDYLELKYYTFLDNVHRNAQMRLK